MNLCYSLAAPLYRWRHRQRALAEQKVSQSPEAYWQWQFDSSGVYFEKFWDLRVQLAGKRVLDIGCGLGGRAAYLAGLGASEVVGCDINGGEVARANMIATSRLDAATRSRLRFVEVEEGELPAAGAFDIVVLVDSLEHVQDPVAMLNVAYAHLRPGGVCYFGTVGWYHYNAAHLMSLLPIPFVTLFFSDRSILEAVRRILGAPWYVPTMWDSDPPPARWTGVTDLRDRPGEYLNKVTIRGIRRAMEESRFGGGQLRVSGFSWRRQRWMRWMNVLAAVPGMQEAYHSGCFGRMVRGGEDTLAP